MSPTSHPRGPRHRLARTSGFHTCGALRPAVKCLRLIMPQGFGRRQHPCGQSVPASLLTGDPHCYEIELPQLHKEVTNKEVQVPYVARGEVTTANDAFDDFGDR